MYVAYQITMEGVCGVEEGFVRRAGDERQGKRIGGGGADLLECRSADWVWGIIPTRRWWWMGKDGCGCGCGWEWQWNWEGDGDEERRRRRRRKRRRRGGCSWRVSQQQQTTNFDSGLCNAELEVALALAWHWHWQYATRPSRLPSPSSIHLQGLQEVNSSVIPDDRDLVQCRRCTCPYTTPYRPVRCR